MEAATQTVSASGTHALAPLRVAIKRQGIVVRVVEIADPRERFCKTFNADSYTDGLTAEPLDN